MLFISGKATAKDISIGPFDIVGKYLQEQAHDAASLNERLDLYFNDYMMAPLMVQVRSERTICRDGQQPDTDCIAPQENYLRVAPALARPTQGSHQDVNARTLDLIAQAADSISQGDLVDAMIHGYVLCCCS
jgi:replication factor C subunit 1